MIFQFLVRCTFGASKSNYPIEVRVVKTHQLITFSSRSRQGDRSLLRFYLYLVFVLLFLNQFPVSVFVLVLTRQFPISRLLRRRCAVCLSKA